MSESIRDKLINAIGILDGTKSNPEHNSQMLWDGEHEYLRKLLCNCIKLIDLKKDVRCCDCANQGSEIRYWCQHSGGLVPIKCASFEEKSKWISVKDELPKVGDEIRIMATGYIMRKPGKVKAIECYQSEEKYDVAIWLDTNKYRFHTTHWQPLPEKLKRHKHCYDCGEMPKDGKWCPLLEKCVQDLDACWQPKKQKEEKPFRVEKWKSDDMYIVMFRDSHLIHDGFDDKCEADNTARTLNELWMSARDKKG